MATAGNIITFITIITIFFLLFLLMDQGNKKSIKSIVLLLIFLIGVWFYYFRPFYPTFLVKEKMFSEIELEQVPSWHLYNKLTEEENNEVLSLIKAIKVRRLPSGISSYSTRDNLVIFIRDRKKYMNLYTIVINPDEKTGRILKSASDKSYIFEINQEKIDALQNIFNEYYQLAFDKIPNEEISYKLKKKETLEDYSLYELSLRNNGKTIQLNQGYIAYKYDNGRSYWNIRNANDKGELISFDFKVLNENKRTFKFIKLVLRGEVIVDGEYKKFQKVIDF